MYKRSFIVLASLCVTSAAAAEGPCKDKADVKFDSYKALMHCVADLKGGSKDDCSAKLSAFIEAAKTFKTCHVAEEKKDANKPCGPQRDANQVAHKALHECLQEWTEDSSLHETDPTDRCSTELATVVRSELNLSACKKGDKKPPVAPKAKK